MKIFQKRFVRRIFISKDLEELIENLQPWIDEVNRGDSPLMFQVSSYFLRKYGSSAAPRFFKKIVASEIFRLTGIEDMRCTILLAIVDAYKAFDPNKGSNLASWLSWRIPYIMSKYVQCMKVDHIEPYEKTYEEDYSILDDNKIIADIIFDDLNLSDSHKQYYRKKVNDKCRNT